MLQRGGDQGAVRLVTGDSVYGGDRRLRVWLEQHAIPHVLAVKRTEPLLTMTDRGPGQVPAEQLLAPVEPGAVVAAERRGGQQAQTAG